MGKNLHDAPPLSAAIAASHLFHAGSMPQAGTTRENGNRAGLRGTRDAGLAGRQTAGGGGRTGKNRSSQHARLIKTRLAYHSYY